MKKSLVLLLAFALLLAGCGEEEVTTEAVTTEEVTEEDTLESWAVETPFEMEETPITDFTVSEGVATAYNGTSKTVRVPEDITKIAKNVFSDSDIEVLVVGENTTYEEGFLEGCFSLISLQVPSVDGALSILFGGKDFSENSAKVPHTLKYLAVTNQEKLEDFALANVSSLQYLSIQGKCESLGFGCLRGCTALQNLTLPYAGGSKTENTFLGYLFGCEYAEQAYGFYPECLYEITLTEENTAVGVYAFYRLESLRVLHLAKNTTALGVRACYNCKWLKTIENLPKTIGQYALYGTRIQ